MGSPSLEHLPRSLPHREPFHFISEVTALSPGESGRGVWRITGHEDFFRGHFPGEPLVPGVLLSEALAQLSGLVGVHGGSEGTPRPGGRLIQVDMRYDAPVTPPAAVELHARLTRALGPLRQFEVSAHVGGVRVARGTLALAVVEGAIP